MLTTIDMVDPHLQNKSHWAIFSQLIIWLVLHILFYSNFILSDYLRFLNSKVKTYELTLFSIANNNMKNPPPKLWAIGRLNLDKNPVFAYFSGRIPLG